MIDPTQLTTKECFDVLRMETDENLALVIDHLEERWLIASSAAKLWMAEAGRDALQMQQVLDKRAREQEWAE